MALTGVVSQVFMGVRISRAQCHNHPFGYPLASSSTIWPPSSKTVSRHRVKMQILGIFLNERAETSIMWPPEDKAKGKTRAPVKAAFPFPLDEGDGLTAPRLPQVSAMLR